MSTMLKAKQSFLMMICVSMAMILQTNNMNAADLINRLRGVPARGYGQRKLAPRSGKADSKYDEPRYCSSE